MHAWAWSTCVLPCAHHAAGPEPWCSAPHPTMMMSPSGVQRDQLPAHQRRARHLLGPAGQPRLRQRECAWKRLARARCASPARGRLHCVHTPQHVAGRKALPVRQVLCWGTVPCCSPCKRPPCSPLDPPVSNTRGHGHACAQASPPPCPCATCRPLPAICRPLPPAPPPLLRCWPSRRGLRSSSWSCCTRSSTWGSRAQCPPGVGLGETDASGVWCVCGGEPGRADRGRRGWACHGRGCMPCRRSCYACDCNCCMLPGCCWLSATPQCRSSP